VEELLAERGVHADHVTVWRWVQHYAPEMERRLRQRLKATNDLGGWMRRMSGSKASGCIYTARWIRAVRRSTFFSRPNAMQRMPEDLAGTRQIPAYTRYESIVEVGEFNDPGDTLGGSLNRFDLGRMPGVSRPADRL
jgi:hypothetical protein